jgi:hypothetical protein
MEDAHRRYLQMSPQELDGLMLMTQFWRRAMEEHHPDQTYLQKIVSAMLDARRKDSL